MVNCLSKHDELVSCIKRCLSAWEPNGEIYRRTGDLAMTGETWRSSVRCDAVLAWARGGYPGRDAWPASAGDWVNWSRRVATRFGYRDFSE